MTELLGLPVVSLTGTMQEYNVPAIDAIIRGFSDFGKNCFVFDLNKLVYSDDTDLKALTEILKSSSKYLRIHVVCSGESRRKLKEAELDKRIHLYSTTDELADLLKSVTSMDEI